MILQKQECGDEKTLKFLLLQAFMKLLYSKTIFERYN